MEPMLSSVRLAIRLVFAKFKSGSILKICEIRTQPQDLMRTHAKRIIFYLDSIIVVRISEKSMLKISIVFVLYTQYICNISCSLTI